MLKLITALLEKLGIKAPGTDTKQAVSSLNKQENLNSDWSNISNLKAKHKKEPVNLKDVAENDAFSSDLNSTIAKDNKVAPKLNKQLSEPSASALDKEPKITDISLEKPPVNVVKEEPLLEEKRVINVSKPTTSVEADVVWEGSIANLEFSYLDCDKSKRRTKVNATKIIRLDDSYAIIATCAATGSSNQYNISDIVTKMIVPGHKKRISALDWVNSMLGIEVSFDDTNPAEEKTEAVADMSEEEVPMGGLNKKAINKELMDTIKDIINRENDIAPTSSNKKSKTKQKEEALTD